MQFKHKKHSVFGCDTRVVSKLYAHTPGLRKLYGKDLGKVLSDLIQDPPIEIDNYSHWGLSPQGISIMPDMSTGIYNAWDWVGKDNYPNAADIWMQVIEKDDNALVPITKDLQMLTEFESKRVLVHPHGSITDGVEQIKKARVSVDGIPDCFLPEGDYHDMHVDRNDQMCASLWWQVCQGKREDDSDYAMVEVGDMTYRAGQVANPATTAWKLAIIGKIPIMELHLVIGNPEENEPDVNKAIDDAAALLGGLSLNLPLYATDN